MVIIDHHPLKAAVRWLPRYISATCKGLSISRADYKKIIEKFARQSFYSKMRKKFWRLKDDHFDCRRASEVTLPCDQCALEGWLKS